MECENFVVCKPKDVEPEVPGKTPSLIDEKAGRFLAAKAGLFR
jgi:hypothetical protein